MQDTADRIRERMNDLNIKQADIQRATGAGKATISSWVKGATLPSSEYISKLADVLKSDVNWLLTGAKTKSNQFQEQNEQNQSQKQIIEQLRQQIEHIKNPTYNGMIFQDAELIPLSPANEEDTVPIISWVAAGSWSNVEPVSLGDEVLGKLARPSNLSKRGFALIVKGRSMLPEFKPDDIIFVEPETGFLMLKDGDLVIVSCNDDTESTFKQLIIGETPSDMYLKPLNPEWHEQKMLPVGDCNLVGKVVGKYVKY